MKYIILILIPLLQACASAPCRVEVVIDREFKFHEYRYGGVCQVDVVQEERK